MIAVGRVTMRYSLLVAPALLLVGNNCVAFAQAIAQEIVCPENPCSLRSLSVRRSWTFTRPYVPLSGTTLRGFARLASAELVVGGSTGFDASLDGGGDYRGNYLYRGEYALFWSSTEVKKERSYHHSVSADGELDKFAAMKGARMYVRCVED